MEFAPSTVSPAGAAVCFELQVAWQDCRVPQARLINNWLQVLARHVKIPQNKSSKRAPVLTIRIVDEQEGMDLNQQFRGKASATNVLAFPTDVPDWLAEGSYLGDLAICGPIVLQEAEAQQKTALAHWAHMVVHGSLHLLGYDHQTEAQAAEMEALETAILADLHYPDPYDSDKTVY